MFGLSFCRDRVGLTGEERRFRGDHFDLISYVVCFEEFYVRGGLDLGDFGFNVVDLRRGFG